MNEKELIEKPYLNPNCLIKSVEEFNQLREWIIAGSNNVSSVRFTLLYDSLLDTDSSQAFHLKCDDKKPTLSIIESEYELRFGGYSSLAWESPYYLGKWKENDPNAFIFSLSKMKKFKCKDQRSVIYCHKNHNVRYGNDIDICNNFTTNTNNYSNFGHSYDYSDINDPKTYLAGSYNFKVRKVEVYKVELHLKV